MEGDALASFGPMLAPVLAGLSIINIVYTWWRTRDQNVESRFRAGSERMDRIDGRLASVEQTLRNLPAKDDLHRVELALGDVRGEMREIRASIAASTEHGKRQDLVLSRLENYLLEHGGKRP